MFRFVFTALILGLVFSSCGTEEKPSPQKSQTAIEDKTMDSIAVQISKAREFQENGQYDQALQIANAMIQKFPGQLDALSIKAEILKAQGQTKEALAILEKAYAMQPRDKETAYNLAYEYAEAKHPKALSLTDTLIKYDKTETVARAWYIKATYYNNLGNVKEALRYYDSSTVADYHFLDTYFDKGQILFKQKNFEAALKTFAIGQKLSPGDALFYYWVAKTQEAMGNKVDAKTNYERAYVLDNSMTEAKAAAEKL